MNFQVARANMVAQQVQPWQVVSKEVLQTLAQIPRENFVPAPFLNLAYSDIDIPIADGQTMLSPKVVGRALQAFNFTGKESVLEVGTGTGYVTACLTKLAGTVISVEIQPTLLKQARQHLEPMHCRNLTLVEGNAVFGWGSDAPYDAILITGSYPLGVPEKVCEQLKIGGKLFAIVGSAPSMQAILIERHEKSQFITQTLFETVVPALIHAPQSKLFQF